MPSARYKKSKPPVEISELRRSTHDANIMSKTIEEMQAPNKRNSRIKGIDLFQNQKKRPSVFVHNQQIREQPEREDDDRRSNSSAATFSESSSEESDDSQDDKTIQNPKNMIHMVHE